MERQKFLDYLISGSKTGELSFKEDADLSKISTFGIGGKAAFLVEPKTENALIKTVKIADNSCIRRQIVGNCSNILFSDNGFDGVIISTKQLAKISESDETFTAECGVLLPTLCRYAEAHSYGGFDGLCSIPATVGGAFYTNAGAFGYEFSSQILSYRVYLPSRDIICTKSVNKGDFSYRKSPISGTRDLLLSVCFVKTFKQSSEISEEIRSYIERRQKTQPSGKKSCGCYFKRPINPPSASELIDKAGLKNMAVNDARVSEKHAGFIINDKKATSADVRLLAEKVRLAVYEKFGVMLEDEVIFVE